MAHLEAKRPVLHQVSLSVGNRLLKASKLSRLYNKTLYNEKTIKINATYSLMENIELQSYLEILLDAKMTFINVFIRYYFF